MFGYPGSCADDAMLRARQKERTNAGLSQEEIPKLRALARDSAKNLTDLHVQASLIFLS